jgi:hypothetical protein
MAGAGGCDVAVVGESSFDCGCEVSCWDIVTSSRLRLRLGRQIVGYREELN